MKPSALSLAIGAAVGETRGGVAPSGPRAHVMAAVPTYTGDLHYRWVEAFAAAIVYSLKQNVWLELRVVAGASLVQYARNQLLREFLEDKAFTHLMWIDADVGFDPRAIVRLLEHKRDVVGGVYPMKTEPIEWPYEAMPDELSTGLHRAKVMPGGFLLMSRHAAETVAAKAPQYWHYMAGMKFRTPHVFDLVLENETLLGEDVILTRRLREAGFDVWCDPDMHFRHCGRKEWRANLADAIKNGASHSPLNGRELARLAAGSDDEILEACEAAFKAWGNTWAAPVPELVALVTLARGATEILECGSGLSTVLMAAANSNAHVYALESDERWAARVRAELERQGLTNATVYDAPLDPDAGHFYTIPPTLPAAFDLAFVDGPVFLNGAGLVASTDTRRPFFDQLAGRVAGPIVVDDAEQYVAELAPYRHEVVCGRFAICANQPAAAAVA